MEENQILQITTADVKRIEQALEGNSVRNMRRALDKVRRRLIIFERRLIELRSNESIIKSRIYNNADALFIDANYSSGKVQTVDPIQSYVRVDGVSDPHQNYSYNRYNLHTTSLGVSEMDSELSRIDSEIKAVQAELRKYEDLKNKIEKALEDAEAQKKKSLKSTLGQILPPTSIDLEQDKIARARVANILLLYKIALNYRELSYVPASAAFSDKRLYPDEAKLPRQLKILRQIFWSHAQAPGLEFDRKDELTYDDPANTDNLNILAAAVGETRYTSKNSKVSLDIDKYVKEVRTIANDPLVSEGIERKPDPTLPSADSLSEKTKSYPGAVLRVGDFYLGSFEIPTFLECMKKWWKKKNANLYYGLPQCLNVVEPYATTGDEKENAHNTTSALIKTEAESNYLSALTEAKALIQEEKAKNVGNLPSDAKDWVKVYVETYGDSPRGTIDYGGQQVMVLRGVSADSTDDALNNANKLVTFPPGSALIQKDSYSYLSIIGYLVTFQETRFNGVNIQKFVYPEDKEDFDETNGAPLKSVEQRSEYIGFVLYG